MFHIITYVHRLSDDTAGITEETSILQKSMSMICLYKNSVCICMYSSKKVIELFDKATVY